MTNAIAECLAIIGIATVIIVALIKFVQMCNGDENAD